CDAIFGLKRDDEFVVVPAQGHTPPRLVQHGVRAASSDWCIGQILQLMRGKTQSRLSEFNTVAPQSHDDAGSRAARCSPGAIVFQRRHRTTRQVLDKKPSFGICRYVVRDAGTSPIHRRHILRTISHARPSARQSRRTSPFDCPRIIRSITDVPKPWRVGFLTAGPPLSVQRRIRYSSLARSHVTSTWPLGTDRDPYLAALVASSCRITLT